MLLFLSTVLYSVLAVAHSTPTIYPDESIYGNLAKSLGSGHGLTWRGEPMGIRAALYIYVIATAWKVASGVGAYNIAKLEGTAMIVLTAVPIWFAAKRLATRRIALACAALTLSGTWMLSAANLATETIALPLATASLVATLAGLRRPASRWIWIALALALLAAWARFQVVVLIPAIGLALLLDVARQGTSWRPRARAHRWALAAIGGIAVLGGVVLAARGSVVLGSYAGILEFHTGAGTLTRFARDQLLALVIMTGFIPLPLALGCSLRPAAWRDDVIGPFLAVLWPVTVVFTVQSAFFIAGLGATCAIQRYVDYAAPIGVLFACVVVARPAVLNPFVAVVAAVSSLTLLATPNVCNFVEARAAFAVERDVEALLPGTMAGAAQLVAAAATGLLALGVAMAGRRRGWSHAAAAGLIVAVGACLITQSVTAWRHELPPSQAVMRFLPDDPQWVDHHSRGPVGALISSTVAESFAPLELFNSHIARVFVEHRQVDGAPLHGWVCGWRIAHDGRLLLDADPGCDEGHRELLIADPLLHATFYGERRSFDPPGSVKIVEAPTSPRALAMVGTPCLPDAPSVQGPLGDLWPRGIPEPCHDTVDVRIWADDPGTVLLTFAGAPVDAHAASVGFRQYVIRPATTTTIALHVPRGAFHRTVVLDWNMKGPTLPALADVRLEQNGHSRSLLD